jgi:hypothetical protein
MPFSYFNKINKLRPNDNLSVVKKTQKTPFGVADSRQLPASKRSGLPEVTTTSLDTWKFGLQVEGGVLAARALDIPNPATVKHRVIFKVCF